MAKIALASLRCRVDGPSLVGVVILVLYAAPQDGDGCDEQSDEG